MDLNFFALLLVLVFALVGIASAIDRYEDARQQREQRQAIRESFQAAQMDQQRRLKVVPTHKRTA